MDDLLGRHPVAVYMFATVQTKVTETLLLVVEIVHTDKNEREKSSYRPGSWTLTIPIEMG